MSIPAAYLGVVLIWSTTPLAIQWSTQGTDFAFAVFLRMLIGCLLAAILVAAWRIGLPLHARARRAYLLGGLALFGAMSLTYWGARFIHSGLISVLFGLSPLLTSALARVWLDEPPLRPTQLAGLLLGVAGLAIIFLHDHGVAQTEALAGLAAVCLAVLHVEAAHAG